MTEYTSIEVLDPNGEGGTPGGKEILYQCHRCGKIIPSVPEDNIGCDCDNIFIDVDYGRLCVQDWTQFSVLRIVS